MAERLSDLALSVVGYAEDDAGEPINAVSLLITYQDDEGVYHTIIHAPSDLKALCHQTIRFATEAAHTPAAGLH